VVAETAGLQIGESVMAGAVDRQREAYGAILHEGVERLRARGFNPTAKLVQGEPAKVIAAFARDVSADLVVVGYRHKGLMERWWSGSTDAYLVDHVGCSLLIGRNNITDEQLESSFNKA
jgi:nucleotide-binding universal stress UspA family protein